MISSERPFQWYVGQHLEMYGDEKEIMKFSLSNQDNAKLLPQL